MGFQASHSRKNHKKYELHVEVWEAEALSIVVVSFRGMENSIKDWISNLRWFISFLKDQCTLGAQKIEKEFVEIFAERPPAERETTRMLVTGHSLGGGLAQNFACSFPGKVSQIHVSCV